MTNEQQSLTDTVSVALADGDGGPKAVDITDLDKFKAEVKRISSDSGYNMSVRRYEAQATRFCIWDGQSLDGRKHADAKDGEPAFPFEGASDARIRLADMIVNERVLLLVAAALRNLPQVKGLAIDNEQLGGKLSKVLHWVIKNKLGADYVRVITKVAQFQEGDSPAGCVLGATWRHETALEMKTVTLQDLEQLLRTQFNVPPDKIRELEAMLMNPDRDEESAEYLMAMYPYVRKPRALKVVAELRGEGTNGKNGNDGSKAGGTASFPAPYLRINQPELEAYRLFEDVFFPANTTWFQRAQYYFVREWYSEAEVREAQVSEGWSEDFVTEVLKHEGETGFPIYRWDPVQGDFMLVRQQDKDSYRGLYEVITVFYKAVNEDNIPGVYYFPFHHGVDIAGKDRELCDYEHGQYPAVYFSREILTSRLWDARGVPELLATDQYQLKLLADSFADNVSLTTLPNIKVPRRRSKLSLKIGPLIVIKEDRPGDVSWMQPPPYPVGNDKQQAEIRRRTDEYFGRISESVPPTLTQLHQSGMVTNFLTNLSEALSQVLQLCQQYLPEEELAMIGGDNNAPVATSREEIQGKFRVELSFDPRDLDMTWLKEICTMIAQFILPIDTLGTVARDKLVQRLFSAIAPELAAETLTPVQTAQQSEVKDEESNFTKINAGIEPEMVASGQNFPLRLQVLQGIGEKNPEAFRSLNPTSQKILAARVKYLENQVQQIKNAQIGRQVGQPALGDQAGPGAGAGAPAGIGGAAGTGPAGMPNGQ